MKKHLHKAALQRFCAVLLCAALLVSVSACSANKENAAPEKVRVLIVPKFEVDAMTGDYPGEAQFFYEKYCPGEETRSLPHLPETAKFYYNEENGVALLVTGAGKTAAALAMTAVLSDPGYDLTEAYVISAGCAGGSCDTTTLGDVVIVTGAYDNELGHTADIREFDDPAAEVTWFYDNSYDSTSNKLLDQHLAEKVYEMTKDVPLRTTEQSGRILSRSFPGEEWRLREPCVLKGAALTGDSYWKGIYGHRNALAIMETYGSPDPYTVTEMEELTMANTLDCYGMLDRLVSLRVVVDLDVFLQGDSPEKLWCVPNAFAESIDGQGSEALDIFEPGMQNLFDVAEVVIDAVLSGEIA